MQLMVSTESSFSKVAIFFENLLMIIWFNTLSQVLIKVNNTW